MMLSIVYITMNRSSELIRSIESCERCVTIEHDYVVVDNASTDDTEKKIRELIDSGLKIIYSKQSENHGVAGGRNIAYRLADGDVCYFIDDDGLLETDEKVLDRAYDFINTHSELAAMSTDIYDVKKEAHVIGGFPKGVPEGTEGYVKGFAGGSHFISKTRFPKQNLYPQNMKYGSEEAYFALSAYKAGLKIWYYPSVCLIHRPSSNNRNNRQWEKRNSYINTFVIKRYFYPSAVLWMSYIIFAIRALKNEKLKFWNVINYFKEANSRYCIDFEDKIGLKQYFELAKTYRFLSVL